MIVVTTDTNIVVSSLKSRGGNEAALLRLLWIGTLRACVSPDILREYEEVVRRPKLKFDAVEVRDILDFHRTTSIMVPDVSLPDGVPTFPDPSDTKFIACALAGGAAFIVTGSRRHFPEVRYGGAEVVSARELLARLPAG